MNQIINSILLTGSWELDIRHMLEQLVEELQLDKERIIAWGLCHCILSFWWYIESHERVPEETIACARWFDELRVSLK
ncbi:hypothetical protein CN326_06715 [Bacillus sp. AFS018417]|uniref:hypothetical protein n=1 Tax=unclassified Bacillus (in: firmicutes) TaxID=185979 RepID=UPI000BF3A247|nr:MULTISPECIES: hypothetical protein [unclassified Bacillus (in: firmicutes)]MCP1123762.1 hypothetical protein [Bacillus sp. 3103sda1]PEZ08220.1 hypothetical protein CN326_06715 [Bacillus sp. AFS018417]